MRLNEHGEIVLGYDELLGMQQGSMLGESVRGPQQALLGAGPGGIAPVNPALQLAMARQQLTGQLGNLQALAQARQNAGMAVLSPQAPQVKDSTQIGISGSATLDPAVFAGVLAGGPKPVVTGRTILAQHFKALKGILQEVVTFVYTADVGGAITRVQVSPQIPGDLALFSAFAGSINCFPYAPTEDSAISGVTFAPQTLGNGISWATVPPGIPLTVSFNVSPSVLSLNATPAANTLTSVIVAFNFSVMGESTRG